MKTLLKSMVVATVLREKNNAWWLWDSFKELTHGAAVFVVGLIVLLIAPVTVPVKVVIDWKNIDKAAVNRFWDKWFHKHRT